MTPKPNLVLELRHVLPICWVIEQVNWVGGWVTGELGWVGIGYWWVVVVVNCLLLFEQVTVGRCSILPIGQVTTHWWHCCCLLGVIIRWVGGGAPLFPTPGIGYA